MNCSKISSYYQLPLASILPNMCLKALPEATFAWAPATRVSEQQRCKERTAAAARTRLQPQRARAPGRPGRDSPLASPSESPAASQSRAPSAHCAEPHPSAPVPLTQLSARWAEFCAQTMGKRTCTASLMPAKAPPLVGGTPSATELRHSLAPLVTRASVRLATGERRGEGTGASSRSAVKLALASSAATVSALSPCRGGLVGLEDVELLPSS